MNPIVNQTQPDHGRFFFLPPVSNGAHDGRQTSWLYRRAHARLICIRSTYWIFNYSDEDALDIATGPVGCVQYVDTSLRHALFSHYNTGAEHLIERSRCRRDGQVSSLLIWPGNTISRQGHDRSFSFLSTIFESLNVPSKTVLISIELTEFFH